MSEHQAPEHCAICGAGIPPKARSCPECGADERTGWREQSLYDGIDLPGGESAAKPPGTGAALIWKMAALVLLVIMAVLILRNRL